MQSPPKSNQALRILLSERVSGFLTTQKHNLGYLVSLRAKNDKRERNHKTMLQRSTRIH